RKPLVGQFSFRGKKVFVIANHFNSKGGRARNRAGDEGRGRAGRRPLRRRAARAAPSGKPEPRESRAAGHGLSAFGSILARTGRRVSEAPAKEVWRKWRALTQNPPCVEWAEGPARESKDPLRYIRRDHSRHNAHTLTFPRIADTSPREAHMMNHARRSPLPRPDGRLGQHPTGS
ncbi:hypothetical protein ACIQOV_16510, partial [Kitasatospora sp. NPDC091257]|uniref:hypothetical protein n=1 Tax=Kitasatospora sp. NPDC091257 TaxID=3364084 RepID=UPI0037F3D9D2